MMIRTLFVAVFFVPFTATAQPAPPAPAPATAPVADIFAPVTIKSLMRKACDYQLAEQAQPLTEKRRRKNDWIRAAFYTGVMAAYHQTQDPHYLNAALAWSKDSNFTPHDRRHADDEACGQIYTELYFLKKDASMIEPLRRRFDELMATEKPGRVEWWWCDALYMSPPALARLAKATGERKYLDYMDRMWWDATDLLYDKDESLYYRDAKYFPGKQKTASGRKIFWSRGNGWVIGGTARVLDYLPKDYPTRQKYIDLHKAMAKRIKELQGADGLWRPSLLDPDEFPIGETSGSAFFCYGLTWGINNGHLDRAEYAPVVRKAWTALTRNLNSEGRLGSVQRVAAAPGAIKPEDTHEYAVGAFLLAGCELLKLK